jgi:hypothetical protein
MSVTKLAISVDVINTNYPLDERESAGVAFDAVRAFVTSDGAPAPDYYLVRKEINLKNSTHTFTFEGFAKDEN